MHYLKHIIIILLLFILTHFFKVGYASDSLTFAQVKYRVEGVEKTRIIKFTISYISEEKKVDAVKNTSKNTTRGTVIPQVLYNALSEKVNFSFDLPNYMTQVINLINNDSLKNEALKIFQRELVLKSILQSQSIGVTVENGDVRYSHEYFFNISFLYQGPVIITIPSFRFLEKGKTIATEPIEVKIE
jgi:hypothetical protein